MPCQLHCPRSQSLAAQGSARGSQRGKCEADSLRPRPGVACSPARSAFNASTSPGNVPCADVHLEIEDLRSWVKIMRRHARLLLLTGWQWPVAAVKLACLASLPVVHHLPRRTVEAVHG